MSRRRRCRRLHLSVSLSALVSLLGQASATGVTQTAAPVGALALVPLDDDADASERELYLEVVLNRVPSGQLARFVERDNGFLASAATLRGLGLRWPGSEAAAGLLPLSSIPGLQAVYDAGRQRMLLDVPVEMLDRPETVLGFVQPEAPRPDPAMRAPGLILNYDLFAVHGDDADSVSMWNELRLFGVGPGIWSHSHNARLVRSDGGRQAAGTRLDTSWRLELPDPMVTLAVGDSISGALSWSRPTRFGGVRLSRDFSLQPYRITAPLASFAGEAALPSTVDLYIDGIRQSSQRITPGQFQIDNTPVLSGAGQAQMVVTDLNGQSRIVDFALYGTPQLLQSGLSDWSLELGWIRRDYGIRSFAYTDDPMASGTLRRGLGDRFTVEAHAETTRGMTMGGVGGVWLPGARTGVFSGAYARSRTDGLGGGRQHSIDYQWLGHGFSFNAGTTRRSAGFRDAASLEGSLLPRRTDSAFLGLSTRAGQWNAGYVRRDDDRDDGHPGTSRYATFGWSRQFADQNSVYLHVSRDLDADRGYGAFLSWSMPLDRRTRVGASVRHQDGANDLVLDASRSAPADLGGWGWRAQASVGGDGRRGGQAQVDQLTGHGRWALGVSHWRDQASEFTNAYASASGGLLWMAGGLRPMRRVDEAFAIVSTQGVAGVPVRLENRLVGHTGADGLLLIDRLNPWQHNKLSIDPLSLPADMRIARTELQAVPAGRSGLLAAFPMRRVLSLQVALVDADGQPLPAGSPVWRAGDDPALDAPLTVVGHDSLLYLDDPPPQARLQVRVQGRYCEVAVPAVGQAEGFAELEGVVCR